MPNVWIISSVASIIISFLAGFIFFYMTSALQKTDKKQQLEEITSLLINFVIYIWIGKIIVHFSVFIRDPLAVLAYPSNSYAFYIAIVFITINIIYKAKKQKFAVIPLLHAFVPVFLVASFLYEFMQMVIFHSTYSWGYLGLLMLIIIIYILINERIAAAKVAFLLLFTWSLGKLSLAIILPFTTVFGYLMTPSILTLLTFIFLISFLYSVRRDI